MDSFAVWVTLHVIFMQGTSLSVIISRDSNSMCAPSRAGGGSPKEQGKRKAIARYSNIFMEGAGLSMVLENFPSQADAAMDGEFFRLEVSKIGEMELHSGFLLRNVEDETFRKCLLEKTEAVEFFIGGRRCIPSLGCSQGKGMNGKKIRGANEKLPCQMGAAP